MSVFAGLFSGEREGFGNMKRIEKRKTEGVLNRGSFQEEAKLYI